MNNSRPKITLTNVMRGVHALALYNRLPDAQFKFLIGLILKSNELAFKNPIELTNDDAFGIGGGHTRQGLNRTRKCLSECRVYRNWLISYIPGDRWKKRSSSYKINLDFLSAQGKAWQALRESWSTDSTQGVVQGVVQGVAQEGSISSLDQIRREDLQDRARAREEKEEKELDIEAEILKLEDKYANPYDWIHFVGAEANQIFDIFRFYEDEDTQLLKQALEYARLDDDIVLRKVAEAKDRGIPERDALTWVRDQLGGAL